MRAVQRHVPSSPFESSGTYETGSQEHVYLETQGMVAWTEGDGIVVQGSMQCPYYVVEALEDPLLPEVMDKMAERVQFNVSTVAYPEDAFSPETVRARQSSW